MKPKEKLLKLLSEPINPMSLLGPAMYTIVWGIWVANPIWQVFSSGELYGTLAVVAPEWFWGILAIVCGIICLLGVLKRKFTSTSRGTLILSWHWAMVSIFYFAGDPFNTGGITCLFISIFMAFAYVNMKVNRKLGRKHSPILH